jgi:ribosomal-protein-alanine N-acetyltransferase
MNPKGTQTLITPRLTLRRFALSDAQDMYDNWAGDERVTKYLTWTPHESVEESKKIIGLWLEGYEKDTVYNWAIEHEGKAVGNISVVAQMELWDNCDIGYSLGYAYWGKGLMTEAVKAVIDFLFREVGINRISAYHAAENIGSGKVMQKAGMQQEGISRSRQRLHSGEYTDTVNYSILREEWLNKLDLNDFLAYPCSFSEFITLPEMSDGEISLVCVKKSPALPDKNWVPCYSFAVTKGAEVVGHISLRIGYTEGLYYGGNIGYSINEEYRGRGYAGRACRLLVPVAKAHGMTTLRISNNVNNTASRRVCEKLGARFIRAARLPEWTDMYKEGNRYENLFDWDI